MSLAKKEDDKVTIHDYLQGELVSEVKYEYYDGHIYAMAGASDNHNKISVNILREISTILKNKRSPCTSYIADMKVHIVDKATQESLAMLKMLAMSSKSKQAGGYKSAKQAFSDIRNNITKA